MKESNLIKTVNVLLLCASALLYYGLLYYITEEHMTEVKGSQGKKTEVISIPEPKKEPNPYLKGYYDLKSEIDSLEIRYTVIETDYVGVCFITAYCPWECGYNGENYPRGWTTSSGAICHYSDLWYEPTTCAIDRNYFSYSEYLLIDGKVYVTEDTGPGVRGMWVDCFVESMEEVYSWDTGYKEVYSVYFVDKTLSVKERRLINEWFNNYLHYRSGRSWFDCRNDCRNGY